MGILQQNMVYSISILVRKRIGFVLLKVVNLIHLAFRHLKKLLITLKKAWKMHLSGYQIQKNDSLCASYVLYIVYLTKVIEIDFKSAILMLYCQTMS